MKRYLCARGLSLLSFYTLPLSLILTVLALGLSPLDLTVVTTARTALFIIGLPVSGVLSDRYSPRLVLSICHLLSALPLAIAALYIEMGGKSVPLFAMLMALNSLAITPALPTFVAILPRMTGRNNLVKANSVISFIGGLGMIGGPLLASYTSSHFASYVPLALVSVLSLGVAALASGIRTIRSPAVIEHRIVGDLHEALSELTRNRWILVVMIAFFFVNAGFSGFQSVVGPVVAVNTSSVGESIWALGLSFMGAGMLLSGIFLYNYVPARLLLWGLPAAACSSLPPLVLWLSPSPILLCTSFFCAGIGLEMFTICWTSALQLTVPEGRLGRISTVDTLGSYLGAPIGTAIAGATYSMIGDSLLPLLGAVLAAIALAPLLVSKVRRVPGSTPRPRHKHRAPIE